MSENYNVIILSRWRGLKWIAAVLEPALFDICLGDSVLPTTLALVMAKYEMSSGVDKQQKLLTHRNAQIWPAYPIPIIPWWRHLFPMVNWNFDELNINSRNIQIFARYYRRTLATLGLKWICFCVILHRNALFCITMTSNELKLHSLKSYQLY